MIINCPAFYVCLTECTVLAHKMRFYMNLRNWRLSHQAVMFPNYSCTFLSCRGWLYLCQWSEMTDSKILFLSSMKPVSVKELFFTVGVFKIAVFVFLVINWIQQCCTTSFIPVSWALCSIQQDPRCTIQSVWCHKPRISAVWICCSRR